MPRLNPLPWMRPNLPPGQTPTLNTYRSRYNFGPDSVAEHLTEYMALFSTDGNAKTGAQLRSQVLSTAPGLAQVYLCLSQDDNSDLVVSCVHRPALFLRHPVQSSTWDEKAFVFVGDVQAGNYIEMVELPADAFDVCPGQFIWDLAAASTKAAALVADNDLLDAPDASDHDSEFVQTRKLMAVPQAYVHLILSRTLTPLQAWNQIGAAIIYDQQELACAPLLAWLRTALTWQEDPLGNTLPPINCLGPTATYFPPLVVDAQLHRHRWAILCADLPALDPSAQVDNTDRVLAIANAIRNDTAQAEAARQAAANLDAQPRQPSDVFPQTAPLWHLVAGVAQDNALPPLFGIWANAAPAERRLAFSRCLEERARQPDAVTRVAPIVTKELYEMVLQGRLASHIYQINDLTVGVSPFTCGFIPGQQGSPIPVRIERYDLSLQGLLAPTVAEQALFSTKEVPLPTTTYQCGAMLKATSLVLDVVHGVNHAHAQAFRSFCNRDWSDMMDALEQVSLSTSISNVFPRICREVQVLMTIYLRRLLAGELPQVPLYSAITEKVMHGSYHQLQEMPLDLVVPAPPGLARPYSAHGAAPGAAPGATPGVAPGATPGAAPGVTPAPANPNRRDPGTAVTNPTPFANWTAALAAANVRLQTLRPHVPKTTDRATNTPVELCLSYHLRGSCFSNCARRSTHRNLNAVERSSMNNFVQQHVVANAAPAPAPAQPPQAPA